MRVVTPRRCARLAFSLSLSLAAMTAAAVILDAPGRGSPEEFWQSRPGAFAEPRALQRTRAPDNEAGRGNAAGIASRATVSERQTRASNRTAGGRMTLEFGVFDHLDRNDLPLQRFLRTAAQGHRGVRSPWLLCLPPGRASLHAARHGAVAERIPLGHRTAHAAPALRHLRLCAAGAPSAAGARRNLHARPHERRHASRSASGAARCRSRFPITAQNAEERQQIYAERLELILKAFTVKTLDWNGRYDQFENVPMEMSSYRSRIRRCGTARIRRTAPSAPRARA